jgi:mono/diheme cytochrome c family protein
MPKFMHRKALVATVAVMVMTLAGCHEGARDKKAAAESKSVATGPNLGVEVTHADIAAWDIAIGPDGSNLPPGGAKPVDGKELYAQRCSYCHGDHGEGNVGDRLVGGIGTLASEAPVRSVGSYWPYATTLFDYIRRAMPLNTPQTLTDEQVYALSAYILAMNGIIKDDEEMNARTLPAVKMPNRDNFFIVYPRSLK